MLLAFWLCWFVHDSWSFNKVFLIHPKKYCCLCCVDYVVVLEARHVELFLHDEYRNGVWDYMDLGNHYAEELEEGVPPRASAAIFDLHHVDDPISKGNSILSN